MKYIKTIMDSLSAITTSEAGQACLRISKAKTDEDRQKMLLRFSADFSDLDDLLGKADEALQVLNENRPQFDYDHCEKTKQPRYLRDIADYLIKCSEIFIALSKVLSHLSTYMGVVTAELSVKYAKTFNVYAEYIIKTYIKPEEKTDKGKQPEDGKKPKTFDEFILIEDKEGVKAKLHQLLDGQKGIKLACRVVAAQEVGLIDKQVGFADLKSEFHVEGSKQAYSFAIIKIGENAERRQPHYKYEIEQLKANLMA